MIPLEALLIHYSAVSACLGLLGEVILAIASCLHIVGLINIYAPHAPTYKFVKIHNNYYHASDIVILSLMLVTPGINVAAVAYVGTAFVRGKRHVLTTLFHDTTTQASMLLMPARLLAMMLYKTIPGIERKQDNALTS